MKKHVKPSHRPASDEKVGRAKSLIYNDMSHLPTLPTKKDALLCEPGKPFRPGEVLEVGRKSGKVGRCNFSQVRLPRALGVNDGGHVVGQDHHRARFSDHDIWLMRELRDGGMSLQLIAEKFETSRGAVHDYCTGRRRSHTVTGQRVRIAR